MYLQAALRPAKMSALKFQTKITQNVGTNIPEPVFTDYIFDNYFVNDLTPGRVRDDTSIATSGSVSCPQG
jgi:hypothetical protein